MLIERISELKQLLMAEAGLVEKMILLAMDGLANFGTAFLEAVNTFET